MRNYILTALLAGTVATPAMAQEASPFTGLRVEAIGGYDVLRSGERDDGVNTGNNNGDESIEGVAYGIGAGFDFDLGGLVVGAEAELGESTGKQETGETIDGVNFTTAVRPGRDVYLGGRIGLRAGTGTLLYAKAGYTNLNLEGDVAGSGQDFRFAGNVDGYRLGAGIEQLFGPKMYGKVEYRYSNYSNLDFRDDFSFNNFDREDFDTDIDLDRHQIVAGIGLRF